MKWPGPRGAAAGRPGWHIECSAMSKKHLGDTIDLHSGGVDLLFPHHENEIAQSECCNGHLFSHHWYHSEHLLVDGAKMSKALGNLYTLDDLTAKGFSPMAVRYALLAGHPRKQLNFTLDSLHAARKRFTRYAFSDKSLKPALYSTTAGNAKTSARFGNVLDVLRDDLNLPGALGALFTVINSFNTDEATEATRLLLSVVNSLWLRPKCTMPKPRCLPPSLLSPRSAGRRGRRRISGRRRAARGTRRRRLVHARRQGRLQTRTAEEMICHKKAQKT